MPWVGFECVIVVFPDHTHLLFGGSIVVDLLFYVPPIVCGGFVLVFVLVCFTLYPF